MGDTMDEASSSAQVMEPEAGINGAGEPPNAPTSRTLSEGEPPEKRRPWVWVGVAAGLLVIAGLLFASSSQGGGGLLFLLGRGSVDVPLVVGLPQAAAETSITAAGLRVGQVSEEPTLGIAPGFVVSQSPAGNDKVEEESAVDLVVSVVPEVSVPDVVGKTQSAASQALAEQGLRVGTIGYANSTSVDAGDVTAQDPKGGTQAAVGAAVAITVSKGEAQGQVPNVVGLSQSDAESTVKGAGFSATSKKATSTSVPAGDVITQSPAAGAVATAGSTVTLTVSSGAPAAPKATVPDLLGMGIVEAFNALQKADLKMNIAFGPSEEYVLKIAEQDPAAGASVELGTVVTVTIGLPSFTLDGSNVPAPSPTPTATPEPSPDVSAGVLPAEPATSSP